MFSPQERKMSLTVLILRNGSSNYLDHKVYNFSFRLPPCNKLFHLLFPARGWHETYNQYIHITYKLKECKRLSQ